MTGQAKRKSKAAESDAVSDLHRTIRNLRKQLRESATALTERTTALNAALEQQTATAEVLQVINSSPGDLAPVFDAMLERALRLCSASSGALQRYDGGKFIVLALRGPQQFEQWGRQLGPLDPQPGTMIARIAQGEGVVQVADITDSDGYRMGAAYLRGMVEIGGFRTILSIALHKDDNLLGALHLYRQEVRPFSEREIALLQSFANQAVIAMENARLITETREALEQQTATAEVLEVINSSPGDLQPVFDAMLEKAARLCGADFGGLFAYDGQHLKASAILGATEAYADFLLKNPVQVSPTNMHGRLMSGERYIHIPDVSVAPAYLSGDPMQRAFVDLGRGRTVLGVPLWKDKTFLGELVIYRCEVRPFSNKQIALLQNFAAQAEVAIDNARLITETREALEQQTATAEVLEVINSSPGDLAPVFDAMLHKAVGLCGAGFGSLWIYEREQFHVAAVHALPTALAEFVREPVSVTDSASLAEIVRGQSVVHVTDLAVSELYYTGNPVRRAYVDLGGARTLLSIALRKDNALLGAFNIYRQEVRPFSDKQIALVQNFAAQAVIAMENARLITETREALEQQTATAEVLGVINSSPGDLVPVFDAMLEKAMRLCGAAFGLLFTYDGEQINAAALHNIPQGFAEFLRRGPVTPAPNTALASAVREREPTQIPDVLASGPYREGDPFAVAAVVTGGVRTVLSVPLVRDDAVLGVIAVFRQEVRPFTYNQIALLRSFAAQAVIAMENARLITETREALEQQTATAEVLSVINSSPGNLVPVFDAILEKAHSLCGVVCGSLQLYDGDKFRAVATHGLSEQMAERLRQGYSPGPNMPNRRLLLGDRSVHIPDLAKIDDPMARSVIEIGGMRSLLFVALRKDEQLIGQIVAAWPVVRPTVDKEVALLQNFAAQAVIAMENARLITETRQALEQQTATAEVLGVINSSPGDLTPVFDAMLERAMRLCDAAFGGLGIWREDRFEWIADRGLPPQFAEYIANNDISVGSRTGFARVARGDGHVQFSDISASSFYKAGEPYTRAIVDLGGARTTLSVPLVKDDEVIGVFGFFRQEVRPFAEKQIALVKNFAAQAVIAMENARLITETREALAQQTATAEVLGVINASPGDLSPVFDAMLEKAMHLCEAAFGQLATYDGRRFHTAATQGVPAAFGEYRRNNPPDYGPGTTPARILEGERVICTEDLKAEPAYQSGEPNRKALVDLGGARSAVIVALRKEDEVLGFIQIYRQEVRSFSNKQIALLENFAAQAVIAMENARLLDEIRQRQAELRVTFDNMGDGVVMFDENRSLAAWNRNFQEMLDLPDNTLAQRPSYADYLRLLAERGEFGSDEIEAELKRRLENTEQEFRTERTRPDGRVIEVRRNAVPDGGFVLIYSDITDRKRSEAEIRAARDAAEAAYRDLKGAQASLVQAEKMASLGQLTAGIAHEIKNPLNFINNFAGLSVELLDELKEAAAPAIATLDEDKRAEVDETVDLLTSNLDKIAEHGRRADGIVKSMLEHSRGGTGERRSVDLNALVDEALNLAYHGGRAQDQSFNITLDRDFDKSIAPIELVPQDITRVCLNLFGNGFYAATKRQKEGADPGFKPTLRVITRDVGDAVEIRVRDNGVGISPEIKDKLFQPFFTTKPTGEGTGLGLSISYDIVTQQHGGTITVESQVGEFTEFTVRLPRRKVTGAAA